MHQFGLVGVASGSVTLFGLAGIAIGLFILCGAGFDLDWFMNNRKARPYVAILGRTGARIFYGLLGVGFVVIGVLVALGVIRETR